MLTSQYSLNDEICACCGKAGVKLRRIAECYGAGESLLVIENIPMFRCPHCHESYFTPQTLEEVERIRALPQTRAESRMVPVANFPF
jgi:YgiT-type zinc finger domain-containing protein